LPSPVPFPKAKIALILPAAATATYPAPLIKVRRVKSLLPIRYILIFSQAAFHLLQPNFGWMVSDSAGDFNRESEAVLAKLSKTGEVVIPGKRSATRNLVPLGAGFKEFWISAFAGMTE